MASDPQLPHPVLEDVLKAEDLRIQGNADRIVRDFLTRWGEDIFEDERATNSFGLSKPLVLTAEWDLRLLDFNKCVLERAGYRVSSAWNARVMLVKAHVLRPRLIVTGLNVLHFYPPAYEWMLANLTRVDPIPMLFVTAASEKRLPREIPRSPRARILGKPTPIEDLLKNASELLSTA